MKDELFAISAFYRDERTQKLISKLQIEDDLEGKYLVEDFYRNLIEFVL